MQESIMWCVVCRGDLTGQQTKYCSPTCTNVARARRAAEWRSQNLDLARARTRESMRKFKERNPDYYRGQRRQWKYGVTPDQFDAMLADQSWQCAICFVAINEQSAFIDHDHGCCSSKRACEKCVRGLLCNKCNAVLGMAEDDTARLHRAAEYVAAHQARQALVLPHQQAVAS